MGAPNSLSIITIVLLLVISEQGCIVIFLFVAVTQQKFGDEMVQFILAQDAKYLDVALGMAREAVGEESHQRGISVEMIFEICHVSIGLLVSCTAVYNAGQTGQIPSCQTSSAAASFCSACIASNSARAAF